MWFACLPVVPAYIPLSGGNIFKYMPHFMLPHYELIKLYERQFLTMQNCAQRTMDGNVNSLQCNRTENCDCHIIWIKIEFIFFHVVTTTHINTTENSCPCFVVHSPQQKSIGLIFRKSRSGSDVRYSAIIIRVVLLSPYLRIRGVSLSSIHYNQSQRVYINRR